ncbi:thioredoxin family protein [Pseudomonas putida]
MNAIRELKDAAAFAEHFGAGTQTGANQYLFSQARKGRLLVLHSSNCPACKMRLDYLTGIASQHPDVDFFSMPTEGNGALWQPLGVTGVPAQFVVHDDGRGVLISGGKDEQLDCALIDLTPDSVHKDSLCPSPSSPVVRAASALPSRGLSGRPATASGPRPADRRT